MNQTSWAAGHCRGCQRKNSRLSEKLGVPGGTYLENAICPECGVKALPEDECQVCGGPAKRGEFWEALEVTVPPDPPLASLLLREVLLRFEVEPKDDRLSRRELSRLMRNIYGSRANRRTYQRHLLRDLFAEYFGGLAIGAQLAQEEQSEDLRKGEGAP